MTIESIKTYADLAKKVGDMVYFENSELEAEYDVRQLYVISDEGADFLEEHTDEVVFYDNNLGVNVWGVELYGVSWDIAPYYGFYDDEE